jgi:NAD(P)-dependent dehydrogenase (short-subunit alcohol dehydrogenase family)
MAGVLLVTGGSRGIGAAVVARAAAAGWDVCLTYRSDADAAQQVVAAARERGVQATAVRADVAVEADVERAFAAAGGMGPLGGVVVNAGVVVPKSRVDAMSAERVTEMMRVNVVGAVVSCREAVRRLSTAHGGAGGSIVIVSSAASRIGSPGEYVDYAASKAATDTLGVGLAKEVADEGVRVNVVRPGIIDTELHAAGGQPDRVERIGPLVPVGRAGTADEVAAAIAWLLSDEASYCTGSVLDVAGGR